MLIMKLMRNNFVKIVKNSFVFLRNHRIVCLCTILGCFLGQLGFFIGFFVGLFIELIIFRAVGNKKLSIWFQNPKSSAIKKNSSLLYLAALAVYCTGNIEFAAQQLAIYSRQIYKNMRHPNDLQSICRSAFETQGLNGDLIIECLASALSREDNIALPALFDFLIIVEYDWDYNRGRKPSEYLSELLCYPNGVVLQHYDKLKSAYQLLGLLDTACEAEVKKAYHTLAALYHPDTLFVLSEEQQRIATEMFLKITDAYHLVLENIYKA